MVGGDAVALTVPDVAAAYGSARVEPVRTDAPAATDRLRAFAIGQLACR